jgi:hypothetical protein
MARDLAFELSRLRAVTDPPRSVMNMPSRDVESETDAFHQVSEEDFGVGFSWRDRRSALG